MDNPDYRYWVAEVSGANAYRITGNVGDSLYQSITVYTGRGVADASAVARIDSEDLRVDSAGDFEVTLAPDPTGAESWVHLPPDATSVWVRYVLPATTVDDDGSCVIARVGTEPGHGSDPARFDRDLGRLGQVIARLPEMFTLAVTPDLAQPNSVRHWSAMAGGAAFTEPGSHYVRGNWLLGADDALLVDGVVPPCRHWNIVLYNRFLNSLDYRRRTVSRSAATSSCVDGHVRFVIADRDPQLDGYDWLDTEGREFGLFVMRFLQPVSEPALPAVRRVALADLSTAP